MYVSSLPPVVIFLLSHLAWHKCRQASVRFLFLWGGGTPPPPPPLVNLVSFRGRGSTVTMDRLMGRRYRASESYRE